jgi:hypothetical protein
MTRDVASLLTAAVLIGSLSLIFGCAVPRSESPSPPPAALRSAAMSGPVELAHRFIEAMRKRDGTTLARLVHPTSRHYYHAKEAGKVSYEDVWMADNVPDGKLDVVVTDLGGRIARSGQETTYRLEGTVFHYPVEPSHGLLISVITAQDSVRRIAHHAIRAERGLWYIVLPSRTVIEGR